MKISYKEGNSWSLESNPAPVCKSGSRFDFLPVSRFGVKRLTRNEWILSAMATRSQTWRRAVEEIPEAWDCCCALPKGIALTCPDFSRLPGLIVESFSRFRFCSRFAQEFPVESPGNLPGLIPVTRIMRKNIRNNIRMTNL